MNCKAQKNIMGASFKNPRSENFNLTVGLGITVYIFKKLFNTYALLLYQVEAEDFKFVKEV